MSTREEDLVGVTGSLGKIQHLLLNASKNSLEITTEPIFSDTKITSYFDLWR